MRELGRGGMGVVYEALDPRTRRRVALKTVGFGGAQLPRRGLERLQREAQALTQLAHAGLVPCLGSGVGPQGFFLAMGLVEGTSLDELIQRSGPMPLGRALQLMGDVGEALSYVHAQGLLHRDVKPANILLSTSGRAVLTDFGLVKLSPELHAASQASLTRSGAMLGTPGYWPPEQAFGRLDQVSAASDVYGWAATLYALLCGEPPRGGRTAVAQAESFARPVPSLRRARSEVPAWLDSLLLRCLAIEPGERPQLPEALEALRSFGGQTQGRPWVQKALLGALLGVALVGVAALGIVILDDGNAPRAANVEPGDDPAGGPQPAGGQEPAGEPSAPPGPGDAASTDPAPDAEPPSVLDNSEDVRALSRLIDSGRHNEAYRYALDWLAREPDSALAALGVAEGCALTGRFLEGFERSEALLQRLPSMSTVWGVRAACLTAMGRYEEAVVAGERSYQLDPRDVYGLPSYAKALHLTNRDELALQIYDELVAYQPTALFRAQRAMARDRVDDYDGALEDVAAALQQDPRCAEALFVRGHVKLAHRDDLTGAADLERALQLGTLERPARALSGLGKPYVERGRAQELLALIDRYFGDSGAEAVFEWRSAALLELKRGHEALAAAEALVGMRKKPRYLILYGKALALVGRVSEGLDQLETVYTYTPPSEGPFCLEAATNATTVALFSNPPLPTRAANALARWIELDPQSLDALGMRLLLWNDQERDADVLAEVARLTPNMERSGSANLRYLLRLVHGETLTRTGDLVGALRELNAALDVRNSARALMRRGIVLRLQGKLSAAASDFEEAATLLPNEARVWVGLMRVKRSQVQLQAAAAAAKRALQLGCPEDVAAEAREILAEAEH